MSAEEIPAISRENSREADLLTGLPPLRTLLWFSVGPFCSQLSSSMYGLASTVWLSHFCGTDTQAVLSLVMTMDFIPVALGFFMCVSSSIQLSCLFAEGEYGKAARVLADMARFCVILGILVPAVLLPVAKPLMRWMRGGDASASEIDQGFDYLLFVLGGTAITCLYYLLCGCLEAEGRTLWFGVSQVSSMVLNGVLFDFVTVKVLKMGMRGPAVSMVAAQFLPMVVIFVWFFRGKFSVKPRFADFLKVPIRESWHGLALGVSSLVSSLSTSVPTIFFQKYITNCTPNEDDRKMFLGLYNDFLRLYSVVLAIYLAICMGFMSAGSFAYTSRNMPRFLRLLGHSMWLLAGFGICAALIMDFATEYVAKLFNITDAHVVGVWRQTAPKFWSSTALLSQSYLGTSMLQATDRPGLGLVAALMTQGVLFPAVSTFWYYYTHNPISLFWSGLTNDVIAITLSALFGIPVALEIKRYYAESKEYMAVRTLESKYV
jgi:Na+-driven multidrug efflux pump